MKLHLTNHDVRIKCGSAPQLQPQDVSITDQQLSHNWDFQMFCVVSLGSKSGDALKPSTAASTRHVSQLACVFAHEHSQTLEQKIAK